MLTSNIFEISTNVPKPGCAVFVHHLETVEGLTFNCSESHLFVFPFSTRTTFNRFRFSIQFRYFAHEYNDLYSIIIVFSYKIDNKEHTLLLSTDRKVIYYKLTYIPFEFL